MLIEECELDGLRVERYAYETEMWLVNQDTNEEVLREMVRGSEPPTCEQSLALIQPGQGGVAVQGEPLTASDIEAWLEPQFQDGAE